MEQLARRIVKFRWYILILVTILTVFFGWQLKNLEINSDVISSLPDDDPDAALFKQIGEDFGGNKIGMVILETEDVFNNQVLEHIAMLTDSISSLEGVTGVTSLTNIINIRGGEEGFEVGQLVDPGDLPYSEAELEVLESRIMENEMYVGSIVSTDGSAAVVMFTIPVDYDIRSVGRNIIRMAESLQLPEKLYYAGLPMMVTEIANLVSSDLFTLIPIAFIVIALVLLLNFKSLRGVLLPLLTSAIAIVWTMGIMALAGVEMTMVTNNIPILLLAIGSAYTIHVINKINQVRERFYHQAVIVAIAYIFVPVLLTALTTMVGFISFVFGAYLKMIVDFGIFTAIGTMVSALLALFFAPGFLYMISPSKMKRRTYEEGAEKGYLLRERFLLPLRNLLLKHPKYILVTWSGLILVSLTGIFLIKTNVDIKDYFRHDSPAREAENIMIEKFGGSKAIFIHFRGDMHDPEVLQTMRETEEFIKQDPNVLTSQSIARLIADLYDALGEGNKIPEKRQTIEQLWFFLDGNSTVERLVSADLDEGIIISKFASADNADKQQFADRMDRFIKEQSCERCEIVLTGMPFIDLKMNQSLIKSQVRSLGIAIIALIILVAILLRSPGAGIIATAPVIATIVILFGLMGFTGIPLNIATVLVASVALGIGVDYSIHIISYFRYSMKISGDLRTALGDTIMVTGKAIVINVISVSTGFLVLVFSEMVPLVYFGILMAVSMLGSGMAALTLLPVILILVKRKSLSLGNNNTNDIF